MPPNKLKPGYWKSKSNQREFFLSLAKKLNITNPHEWGKVSIKDLQENGGISILRSIGSIPKGLLSAFPETQWDKSWFSNSPMNPHGFWKDKNNQRDFMNNVAIQLGIKNPKDWGKVTLNKLISAGGGTLLNIYSCSLFQTLKSIFPETHWKKEWFTRIPLHFHRKENQKLYLEKVAKQLGIKTPRDWGKVTFTQLEQHGGRSVLRFYGNSISKALRSVYPEWKREWFIHIPKYSFSFWNSEINQRQFMDTIASEYHLKNPNDWLRVSNTFIKQKGGKGLLLRFNNSLYLALRSIYPHQNWIFKSNQSIPQFHVFGHIQELFPYECSKL